MGLTAGCATSLTRWVPAPGAGAGSPGFAGGLSAASFVGSRYSDSIRAACSAVSSGLIATSFLSQPANADAQSARRKICFSIDMFFGPHVPAALVPRSIELRSLSGGIVIVWISCKLRPNTLDVAVRKVHVALFTVSQRD